MLGCVLRGTFGQGRIDHDIEPGITAEQGPRRYQRGCKDFADNLAMQEVEVVHVDWSPSVGGDAEMMSILDDLL